MAHLLTRTSPVDLELRGGDGRTVVGIAVPFGKASRVVDPGGPPYDETFRMGAFARTIRERGDRVKFLANHERLKLPLGRATLLREDSAGLYAELRVSKTAAGDEALELIRDGALDGLSIGFMPIKTGEIWNVTRTAVERTEAALREISAVAFPAHAGAEIVGVRSEPAPSLEALRHRLTLLRLKGQPLHADPH
jgi:HK97 family phage prohead protease